VASTVSPQRWQAAGEKKAPPDELSKLFNAFLHRKAQTTCGVPSESPQARSKRDTASHGGGQKVATRAKASRPGTPSRADASRRHATVPDASGASKGALRSSTRFHPSFSGRPVPTRPSRDAIIQRPSLGKRSFARLARFLSIFCTVSLLHSLGSPTG